MANRSILCGKVDYLRGLSGTFAATGPPMLALRTMGSWNTLFLRRSRPQASFFTELRVARPSAARAIKIERFKRKIFLLARLCSASLQNLSCGLTDSTINIRDVLAAAVKKLRTLSLPLH